MSHVLDASTAHRLVDARRRVIRGRMEDLERRLVEIRRGREEWTDEEHDPEGFDLTFAWQAAEGSRAAHARELAELDRADQRVDSGDYGRCVTCGEAIPPGQLELRPARSECVACADRLARR